MPTLESTRAAWARIVAARDRRRVAERAARRDVCVVGPGKAFLSGVTYHTYSLASALDARRPTRVILLQHLVPRRFYPGRARVGADLSHVRLPPTVGRTRGLDWWWGPAMAEATWSLLRRPPAVLVVQCWTVAAWHTQLALAWVARSRGTAVVLEVHELADPGEAQHAVVRWWAGLLRRPLVAQADRVIAHSRHQRREVAAAYGLRVEDVEVIVEPAFDAHHVADPAASAVHDGPVQLLFFGTIRPYKGLEDLIDAFALLDESERSWHLTVVGETWEGWEEPARRIARSPARERIAFVNRYVTDGEVDQWFTQADIVVLPYRRSSVSGPLMVAISYGRPVVVTDVGGLSEAVEGYSGAVLVEPGSASALAEGIAKAEQLVGVRHRAPRTWDDVASEHDELYRSLVAEVAP